MPFVKIDTGILRSTLWFDRTQRDVFLSALFMAELHELREDTPQLGVDIPEPTGWMVPAGWYGFVQAAGVGIAHVAQVTWPEAILALRAMGDPELDSRSQAFEGRRLVRINGGYMVLNYMKYRDRDYTAAERQMRYRARKRLLSSDVTQSHTVSPLPLRDPVTPNVTEAVIVTDSRVQSTEYISEVRTLPNGRESPSVLVLAWNALTRAPIPRCVALSKTRATHATARLQEQDSTYWKTVIERIQASDFCRGENDRSWVATFDWLVANDENAIKVLEGKYDNRLAFTRPTGRTAGNKAALDEALRAIHEASHDGP